MTTLKIDDGYVAFPRRTSLAIALSFAIGIVTQTGVISWGASKLDSRIGALEASDLRMIDRSDERYKHVLERLAKVESDRDRLARLEEQMKALDHLLREIRQDIRRR